MNEVVQPPVTHFAATTRSGKKLDTESDIVTESRVLQVKNLNIGDLTFAKEGVGMPPDQEIVCSAKIQTRSQNWQSLAIPEQYHPEALGKRIPKPKMPKGANLPPPSSMANKSRVSSHFCH